MLLRLALAAALGAITYASLAAQTQPTRPHRMGVPPAPSRQQTAPSAYRNQPGTSPVAPAPAPAMSAQDRQAYENCPDPRRFGPKTRTKKMVRIW